MASRTRISPNVELLPFSVFPNEIADGGWGGRGLVRRLPDILSMIEGEHARTIATARLAERRRKNAVSVLLSALAFGSNNT